METQLVRYYKFLFGNVASRYMASINTGIPIQNCCRYTKKLRDLNAIAVIKKDRCRITGEKVEYLSTNPEFFPKVRQLRIEFD